MVKVQHRGRVRPISFIGRYLVIGVVGALLLSGGSALAQTLKDAVEAAWARSPPGRSGEARIQEADAKLDAADRWFAEPPSISLGQRKQRLARNSGAREDEIELALPLHAWNARSTDQAIATAERRYSDTQLGYAKWLLAGEVREQYWNAHLALIDARIATQRASAAALTADDVARRVAAGELALVDAHRAASERDAAVIAVAESELKARQAGQLFRQLTGLMIGREAAAEVDQSTASGGAGRRQQTTDDDHIAYRAQAGLADIAQARYSQAANVVRDPLELTLTSTRARADIGEPFRSTARIGIRIPFATSARNRPRIAEASATRIEAQAALTLARERISADIESAREAVLRWTALQPIAQRRERLARDAATLVEKSFRLGEADLPTRLRADGERFEAERGLERAKAELARATSLHNQALGLLP